MHRIILTESTDTRNARREREHLIPWTAPTYEDEVTPVWRDMPYEERMAWIAKSAVFWHDWL